MTLVKTCGMTRETDIDAVNAAKPDLVGFVFAPSPRQITPVQARAFKRRLVPGIQSVGVFVNAAPTEVAELVNNGTVDVAQLHGDEDEDYIGQLRRLLDRGEIMQVFRIPPDLERAKEVLEKAKQSLADKILFDTGSKRVYGGSGEMFDWGILKNFPRPFFLAGGIGAENASDAIAAIAPHGLDASSSLETEGRKDPEKIRAFVEIVRTIDPQTNKKKAAQ